MKSDHSEFAALIGIDWADRKHDLCLLDVATNRREKSVLEHTRVPRALANHRGREEGATQRARNLLP